MRDSSTAHICAPTRWGGVCPCSLLPCSERSFRFSQLGNVCSAAERFCRPIEETMDAVANELERIRRSPPRRIPIPPSQLQSLQSLPIPRHV